DEDLLEKHHEGLIALTACVQGKIPQYILSDKKQEAKELALKYKNMFGEDSFYFELQHHPNISQQKTVNDTLKKWSKEMDIPLVATCDSHYLKPEDAEIQDILMSISTGSDVNDPDRLSLREDDFSMKTPQQMEEIFSDVPEAIENTQKIKELCNFEFDLGKTRLPKYPVPEGKNYEEHLRDLCEEGLTERFDDPEKIEAAKERLDYELGIINETGFASYFLIVQDFVNWAKENHIVVGPGRGSAGGSLVSYLLRITNIDPLKYDLIFERFLNPGRAKVSMPDIDMDFTDKRRGEVIQYLAEKYGHESVAQIITFGTMAAKAAIRDTGRALGYEYSYCDRVAKMIPNGQDLEETLENNSDFRQLYNTDPKAEKLIDSAKRLEGVVRHASTHACGLVIGNEPLPNRVPLQHPSQDDDTVVTQYEMHAIEDIGLLKMDLLGLKNLTIIEDTLKKIYAIHDKNIDIDNIPLDDEKAFDLLQKGNTTGVFQLESSGFQRYLKELEPSNIEDIIAMVALYRPGPMQYIPTYIKRKHGKEEVEYLHPDLKPILQSTYGVCVYQEQVMRIAQEMAGYTMAEADILRKAIGKKIASLLKSQKEKFLNGLQENGYSEKLGEEIWGWIKPFAQYSFNKSHAAAYAQIAYQTAYLKAHYPEEFMSSLLTADEKNIDRLGFLMNECKRMGIEVLQPDVNESFTYFSVVPDKHQIRFGLAAIKNVGTKLVEEIVEDRKKNGKYKSLDDFLSRIHSRHLNKKSLEALAKAGGFETFMHRNKVLKNMDKILAYSKEIRSKEKSGQSGLFESSDAYQTEIRLKDVDPASKEKKLKWEKELLGLFITGHPLDRYEDELKKAMNIEKAKRQMSDKKVRVGGMISTIKEITTKKGNQMAFMTLQNKEDNMEIIVFPDTYKNYKSVLEVNNIVFVYGKISHRDENPKIIADKVKRI
ncbi:MAG: DNA polymerase III subunit alpha, partial [Patescibacteria group bacterium]